jgi:hypothetical protein
VAFGVRLRNFALAERQTPNAERQTPNAERRTPNADALATQKILLNNQTAREYFRDSN